MKKRHLSILVDDITLRKLHYVSKYEDRSASGQLSHLVNKYIRDFEKEHGKINPGDLPKLRVDKPEK